MRKHLLRIAKRVLPDRLIEWYRRRRALRRYLRALSYEVYHRQVRLDLFDLEGSVAARRDGFYQRLVKEVLERTELILQELDRRIEGVAARHGNELRALREEVRELRARLDAPAAGPESPLAETPEGPGPVAAAAGDTGTRTPAGKSADR